MITVNTKIIALLGMPLKQSFAAEMQNAVYAHYGLDYEYIPIETTQENLEAIFECAKRINFGGLAVTKPNKEAAVQYMDELDPLAEKMGSINTVVKLDGGKLKGYNTDGYGATQSMLNSGIDIPASAFFVWGAGGTGKSVCFALAQAGAKKLWICSRSEKCELLAADINEKFGKEIAFAVRTAEGQKVLSGVAESDVLVNLAGLGMYGMEDQTVIDQKYLEPRHICFDATYNPGKTRFLREAEAQGCKIINGLEMSVYQAARQIELWTGNADTVSFMKQTLLEIVARRSK